MLALLHLLLEVSSMLVYGILKLPVKTDKEKANPAVLIKTNANRPVPLLSSTQEQLLVGLGVPSLGFLDSFIE